MIIHKWQQTKSNKATSGSGGSGQKIPILYEKLLGESVSECGWCYKNKRKQEI